VVHSKIYLKRNIFFVWSWSCSLHWRVCHIATFREKWFYEVGIDIFDIQEDSVEKKSKNARD